MTVYTTLPTDDLNLAVTVIDDPDLVVLNITPASVNVTSAVTSVNGLTGNVTLDTDDIAEGNAKYYSSALFNTDLATKTTNNLTEGGTNLYYTNNRVQTVITNNTEQFIKADSTDTLTNKAGAISQWTNDAGYSTTTGTVTPSSTDTFTNKSGSNSQWTNDEAYLKANALTPYYTSSQVDALPVSTFSNDAGYSTTTGTVTPSSTDTFTNKSGSNSQWTNDEAYIKADSTDTLSNKSGNISQWTNDAGYLTSETDNQTLAFTTPNLSITSGNTVDLTTLTTGFITASSTETLTNKSGNISMFTNDANYSTTTGTVTPSSTDTFTNKSGSNSQWTNDEAYIKADSTDTLTNKSGSNSQWTNDEAYLQASALTPYYTSTQVDALPVSTFTNDAGYLTTETDSQTLSFTTPDLTISNGNSVDLTSLKYTDADVDIHLNKSVANPEDFLKWNGSDYTWQGLSTVAISNSYFDLDDKPTIPTQTVINNNADNSIITGSATADNLNGEADFTWDGNNGVIDGSASNLTTPVLNVKTDNSNWFTGQMMLTDSNDDVCTLVGANRNNFYEYNFTLDPNNTHGRTGATTFAGDYFVAFRKDYNDPANVKMGLTAFGAHGGFDFTVRGDYNSGGGNQYKGKPLNFNCEEANFNLGPDRNVLALTVAEELIDCKVPIGQARLSSDPANPSGGWTYYNTTTNKLRLYVDLTGWVDLN